MSGFFSNNSFEHLFMPVSLTLYGPAKINMAAGGEDTRGNMKWYTEWKESWLSTASKSYSYTLILQNRENIVIEIHVFLATNVIYFRQQVQSNVSLVNSSHSLRDKLCPATVASIACKA